MPNIRMSNSILITGSSGYIGSHLVKYFHQKKFKVYGIDLHFPPKTLQKYFDNHIVEDIANEPAVSHFLEKHPVDLIVHCAAKCLVHESMEKPDLYQEYNVTKATAFLETCLKHKVPHFLFSSTCATYGEPLKDTIDESHPQQPINPYGKTKLEFEKILLSQKNLNVGIVRYFNAAGADVENEIGDHGLSSTRIIPTIIRKISANETIHVYGNDYPTKDGTCVRDYIHISDLCDIHHRFAQRMIEKNTGGIYNLGLSQGYSILELIKTAEKIMGQPAKIEIHPRRPGDPSKLVADCSKVQKDFGWNPQLPLERMIETAWAWFRDQQ